MMDLYSKLSKACIIAEMSENHADTKDRAIGIIHAAKEFGADCIKIQTYTLDTMMVDCDNEILPHRKGYIISQEIVDDNENETLASSYERPDRAEKVLFKKSFKYFKYWPLIKKKCVGEGSLQSAKDGISLKSDIDSYEIFWDKTI